MIRGRCTRLLVLVLAGLFAWPTMAGVLIRCADGAPCPPRAAAEKVRDCCQPKPCHVPVNKRCVVTVTAAPLRTVAEAPPLPAPHALLATIPAVRVIAPSVPTASLAVEQDRPPTLPMPPKLGYAPRPPPVCA